MTEYDYSPEAYERYLATQNRIAKWVDETEQHRPLFQHAVHVSPHHREPSRRRKPSQIYIQPQGSESGSSSSEDTLPPAMYPAQPQPQPRYPAPPAPQPLLSPPPMMQMVYPNAQRPPYFGYPAPATHHRTPSRSHTRSSHPSSSHPSPAYYGMAPTPQVSPAYAHPQQFLYPPTANPHSHPAYVFVPQHHQPKPPHQPVVYLRA